MKIENMLQRFNCFSFLLKPLCFLYEAKLNKVTHNRAIFFLGRYLIAFDFSILSDLNSKNIILIILLKFYLLDLFLVDCLMSQNISLVPLKISKSSLSWSISIQIFYKVVVLLLFLFWFGSQYFCRCVHLHQFLLRAYSHENISQSCNFKYYIVFACFLLQINSLFLSALIVQAL